MVIQLFQATSSAEEKVGDVPQVITLITPNYDVNQMRKNNSVVQYAQ